MQTIQLIVKKLIVDSWKWTVKGLIFLFLLTINYQLLTSNYSYATTTDSCNFAVTSNTVLTTANTEVCQTPSGSTAWTATLLDCAGTMRANSAGGKAVSPTAAYTDCQMLYEAPTDPNTSTSTGTITVQMTFADNGAVAATDTLCIWAGTDSTHYYAVCMVDDTGTNIHLYENHGSGVTKIGDGGSVTSATGALPVTMILGLNSQVVKVNGSTTITTTDGNNTSFTKAGVGCGEVTGVAGDDCNGQQILGDDFSVVEELTARRRLPTSP